MDSTLFEERILGLDRKFECEGRKVALIVDNCPAHLAIPSLKAINLVFLSPNTSCQTQTIDQGIIRSTRAFYRGSIALKYIDAMEKDKQPPNITILDAMTILVSAWRRVSAETVQNCFRKVGVGIEAQQSAIHEDDDPFTMLHEEMESMRANFRELLPEGVTPDDVIGTYHDLLTSDICPLSDKDILAESRTDNVDQEDSDEELELLEDCHKRSTATEVRQVIYTLATYSLFVEEDAEEIRRHAHELTVSTEKIRRKHRRRQTIQYFFLSASTTATDLVETS